MSGLVYHAGGLGDFITILPAVRAWRGLRPGERTVLLGKPAYAALASPGFDEVWDAESALWSGLYAGAASDEARSRAAGISSALVFCAGSSRLPSALHSLGVRKIMRQDPFPSAAVPAVDYHLALFRALPADSALRIPAIAFGGKPTPRGRGRVAALHPGSGSAKKNWPLENFAELAALLGEAGCAVAWITGPAEQGLEVPASASVRWTDLQLPDLAQRLSGCALYVGNDSGVSHLAAASGCPTVALFGASDPRVWAPLGRKVVVVGSATQGMNGISVESVWSECQRILRQR